ncbi:MAG TPA: hypothetical protein VJ656_00695, partial [Pyrinomonadaceae bacterium]|nr:hypothetical protein [Pyrinomonadaceae bacterium]
ECAGCREEVASFGVVRESITAWRDEALSGFVSTPLAATPRKKSAIAALRQFFDFSPLWLKAATGFAVVAFCVLAAAALMNVNRINRDDSAENSDPVYTQADVDRIVKETLAKQQSSKPPEPTIKPDIRMVRSQKPKRVKTQTTVAKSRRPLTRAEREQLAADLRLLSTNDESGLNLLGDRINK